MKVIDMTDKELLEEYNKYRNIVDGITKTGFILFKSVRGFKR